MYTVSIDIEKNNIETILNLLSYLKEDIIKSYSISPSIDMNLEADAYFYERKKQLQSLRDDIKLGKMPMYDFESSMDGLIRELES